MKKLHHGIALMFLSASFFCIITNTLFPFIMIVMKVIFFLSGIFCAWCSKDYFTRYFKAYNRKKKETVYNLIFRSGIKSSIVNLLTLYRIIISPFLLILLFNNSEAFKWLLLSAFLTDVMDGFLARRFKVVSRIGAKLDSVADDFLFVVSLIAIMYLHSEVITQNIFIISGMLFILFLKMILLWVKHSKIISGLHTYFTKAAAFLQALFFLHCIFFQPNSLLFYMAVFSTVVALTEEIIIIFTIKDLRQNTRGLFFNRSNA